jgi:hypothetical protein
MGKDGTIHAPENLMSASLRALLHGLIDYAGLFPPARLPLAEALANHVRYRAGGDAWMLGRFICPAAKLPELTAMEELFRTGPPLGIAVLGRGGTSADEFLAGLDADLAAVTTCRERHAGRVVIDVMEVRLPAGAQAVSAALAGAAERTRSAELSLFFEAPPQRDTLPALVQMLRQTPFARRAGFKLRTGGLEPAAFPSSEQIAFALTTCLNETVPFKATAGLHHPLPRFDPGVHARMHGFVNLFSAGVLVQARGIGADRVRAILDDADPTHFRFSEDGLEWQGLTAGAEEIARARRTAVLSFGSCSFDEPRDDLRELGWLAPSTGEES